MLILVFILVLVVFAEIGNVAGWWITCGRYGKPFHWSVFLGPVAYALFIGL